MGNNEYPNKIDEVQTLLEDLYNLFKARNEQVSNAENESNNIELANNEINDEINNPISEYEILQAIQPKKRLHWMV